MRGRVFLTIALLAIVAGAVGCGGSNNSDTSRIRGRYRQWARAILNERVDQYMFLFSPSYLDNGYAYVDVRNFAAGLFDQYDITDVQYRLDDIRVYGRFASATGVEVIDAYDTFDYNRLVRLTTQFEDIWIYEGGNWYLYGNQVDLLSTGKAPFRHSVEAFRARGVTSPAPEKSK